MKVHLYGSLSATGKSHGTERAALAGIIGKEPATVEPEFLDSLVSNPEETFPVKFGDKSVTMSLEDIIYDSPKGEFPHPNTMTCCAGGWTASTATPRSAIRSRRRNRPSIGPSSSG